MSEYTKEESKEQEVIYTQREEIIKSVCVEECKKLIFKWYIISQTTLLIGIFIGWLWWGFY